MPPRVQFTPKKMNKPKAKVLATTIPRVSELSPQAASSGAASRASNDSPIEVSILKYTACATDVMQTLPAEPLWQLQLRHEARPSVSMKIVASFSAFLAHLHSDDPEMPATLQGLRADSGILLHITSHDDPAQIGLVQWRVAFYIVGDVSSVQNAISLFNAFFSYRRANDSTFPDLTVNLHVSDALRSELSLSGLAHPHHVHSPHCFSPFQAGPPAGNKILIFSAEFDPDGQHLQGVFAGQTFPFKDAFEAQEIYGARDATTEHYVRVLPKLDVASAAGRTFFLQGVLVDTLHELVLQLRVATPPPLETRAAEFLAILSQHPQIALR